MVIVGVAMLIPFGWLAYTSLLEWLGFGQTSSTLTLTQYTEIFSSGLYRDAIFNALRLGAITGLVCILLSYPVAYFLSFKVRRHRNALMLLIVCSLFASYLARVFAWRTILGTNGVINSALEGLGLIDKPLDVLLFNQFAVVLTWTNVFMPLTILLLTAAMEDIDKSLLETARDLGANSMRAIARVVLPITMPTAVAAFTYVLVLSAGDYATPTLMGGKGGLMVGQVITDQFISIGNQPQGAALAIVMLIVFVIVYVLVSQLNRVRFKWA